MYFAWLGFYTTSMLYPAVIGFVLWILTESDQVTFTLGLIKCLFYPSIHSVHGVYLYIKLPKATEIGDIILPYSRCSDKATYLLP